MEPLLKSILKRLLFAFFALVITDAVISYLDSQKNDSLKADTEDCSFDEESKEGSKNSQLKFRGFSMPFDDDICHEFVFFNPVIDIEFNRFSVEKPPLKNGHSNYVYSPPEHIA